MVRPVDFVIAGTPRSGTTLVQRLASEVDGVRVPPETHFFAEYLPDLARRRRFPLAGRELVDELGRYAARPYLAGVPLDAEAVALSLGGRAADPVALWCAVVQHLAGAARLVGEKTPGHLLWWRPLATALPGLKVVAVVRDPRGVVASFGELGWGGDPLQNATRWNLDAGAAVRARRGLGAARCLVLRYEDVVTDADGARAALAGFLGDGAARAAGEGAGRDGELFPAWEAWKADATGGIDPSRATAWRHQLPPRVAADVAAACRPGMAALGYDAPTAPEAWRRLARLPARDQARRLARVARNARAQAAVARLSRGWGRSG